MKHRLVALALVAVAIAASAGAAAPPDFASLQVQRFDPPKPAPAFELPDIAGQTHRLADLRGKVVMLFFWTTW